jgi:hypothetical protein
MGKIIEKVAAAWRELVGSAAPTARPALVPVYEPAVVRRRRRY